MTSAEFQNIAYTLPQDPGIYKYFDVSKKIIYVGKAKNLKKRISSYFNKNIDNLKTQELVSKINHIEFTIVNSEHDALLLENALIKNHQPKYNINLKDDKTYPYIVIKKETFSRVFITRRKFNDSSEYLGPFTNISTGYELIDFIKQNIPLRTCKLNLSEQNIAKHKFKVCLEYHLGNCKGPCEGLQTLDEYNESLQQVRNMLKGNLNYVISEFKKEMIECAANLEFEKAESLKKKISNLVSYQSKSVIVSKYLTNMDVFSILRENETAYVNFLMIQNGTIVHTHTVELVSQLEESDEEILSFAISNLRLKFNSLSKEIIVPFPIDYADTNITFTIPKVGDKKHLLDLSIKNVNYFKEELRKKKILRLEGKSDMEKKKVLYELQSNLQLQELPTHIECFDNSNFQGSYPVSAMVCFKNGMPDKINYRRFNVKTVEGINDFATMKEVVFRRYKRLIDEEKELPQLIIIDGGKGQLSAAMESIKALDLTGKVTVVGLAKNEEEIFFPGDQQSLKLSWDSDSLKLIRMIRDEVHRFGITFHRNQRSKGTFKNELETISGIGKQTIDDLLKKFKSVKNIKAANFEEISKVIGVARATILSNHFKNSTSKIDS
jgi:excinuclease ABC subunit C